MWFVFFFKQKTAYEIGTGDWSSDVCSSDLDLTADLQSSDEDLSQDEETQHTPVREPQMETVRGKCVVECLIGCSNNPCSISLL